jgi:hypothetical protein
MLATPEEIRNLLERFKTETSALEQQITDIAIYSAGAVSFDTAWSLSFHQRERIINAINKKNKEESGDKTEYM